MLNLLLLASVALTVLEGAHAAVPFLPTVAPGENIYYTYLTQAYCNAIEPGKVLSRVKVNGQDACGCMDPNSSVVQQCTVPQPTYSEQAVCKYTIRFNYLGKFQGSSSGCGSCSRTEGSPLTRNPVCQEHKTEGQVRTSGSCAAQAGTALYTDSKNDGVDDGACFCYTASQASQAKLTKCPLPKANGDATCLSRSEVDPVTEYSYSYLNPAITGCRMRCKTGYHLSPSEKPVTCCQSGYRSNASGTCSKSTNGQT